MSVDSTFTLDKIRLAAQQKADMENSDFISVDEWNANITRSYKELYDLLVSAYGSDYYVASSPFTITTDGVSKLFALPTDFYKLLGVDLSSDISTSQFVTLKPFAFSERNKFNSRGLGLGSNIRYRLHGNKILFNQIPQAGLTVQIWYIPEPTNLTLDTDTLDGIAGWEEYVLVDSAIKALQKEESDTSDLRASKAQMYQRLVAMANDRDAGMPAVVSDVSNLNSLYWDGEWL